MAIARRDALDVTPRVASRSNGKRAVRRLRVGLCPKLAFGARIVFCRSAVRTIPVALASCLLATLSPTTARAQPSPSPARCPTDPRLAAVADAAAREPETARGERLRALAEREGLAAPSIRVWAGRGPSAAVDRAMNQWLASQSLDPQWCRSAVASRDGLRAIVLAPRTAQFDASVSDGGAVEFRVQFSSPVQRAHVVLTAPDGRSFVSTLREPAHLTQRGTWTAQLVAELDQGPIAFAQRTLVWGEPSSDASAAPVHVRDERAWLAALNRARAQRGAPALRSDPLLAQVARARVQQRATRSTVAHALDAEDAGPDRALREAGVSTAQVAENIARAPSLDEAFARLDRSPAHRRTRMDASFDAAAIVAVQAQDGWYVIELFALRPALPQ